MRRQSNQFVALLTTTAQQQCNFLVLIDGLSYRPNEIGQTFLHCQPGQRANDDIALFFQVFQVLIGALVVFVWWQFIQVNGIVDNLDFLWWNVIILDNDIFGDVTHGDDSVSHQQPLLLDFMYQWIAFILTRTVKFSRMHMHDQRRIALLFSDDTRFHSQPVVSVNSIWRMLFDKFFHEAVVSPLHRPHTA